MTNVESKFVEDSFNEHLEGSELQNDDRDVGQFGYKPELRRRFGFWSMLGLSSSIMVTWEGWLLVCGTSLSNGGKAGAVWAFFFSWMGNCFLIASMSELISMIPTAGGQYHWVYVLAPDGYRKFASWLTGLQMTLAWQADMASVFYLMGTMIQGLVVLNYPDYGFQRWHGTLIIWAVILFAISFNTLLARLLPLAEGGILILHCSAFLVFIVPLLYYGDHASAREVFADYQALAGYTPGTSFLVGTISAVFAFLGADGAIHMCEEVHDARRNVPKALMASVVLNGVLGLATVISVTFTIGDIGPALQVKTGFVFIDYFARCLRSNGFATALTVILEVIIMFACVAIMASTSRVTWAFARDGGLPGSSWLKKISQSSRLPIASILTTAVFSFLLSFINIGSSVAFNAIVSLVVAAFYGSYAIPISILVYKRLAGHSIQFGPWHMGNFGLLVNICALIFLTVVWVFSFFPVAIPVTLQSMNWSCVLWIGCMATGIIWYFLFQRRPYSGPQVREGTMDIN